MYTKSKFLIGGIIGAVILIALFFIPTNEFVGIKSYSPESPPPVYVVSNYYDEFEITPSQCITESENVNFDFSIKNNLDEDYRLEVHLVLIDKNEMDLSREAILVEAHSGETKIVTHQTPFNLDMEMCGIELNRVEKIDLPFTENASSNMEEIVPTIEDFKNTLSKMQNIDDIFSKFGQPHDDIGSGIHIYVYELNNSTEIWIGYAEHIWYVNHVDADGNLLEQLFVENED